MKLWRVSLFLVGVAAVLTQPSFTSRYYEWMLAHGAYRADAAARIAILTVGNLFAWLFWGPPFCVALFFVFRGLPAPLRLAAWDSSRKTKSWLVTIGCVAAVTVLLRQTWNAIAWKNYFEAGYCCWWIAVWSLVRAALLSRKTGDAGDSSAPPKADPIGV